MKMSLRGSCYSRVRGEREARDSARDSRPILIAGLSLFYDTPAREGPLGPVLDSSAPPPPHHLAGPRAHEIPRRLGSRPRIKVTACRSHCYLAVARRIFHAG
jgi:hypothetical protein